AYVLDQGPAHRLRRRVVRGALLPAAPLRLPRAIRRCALARAVQGDGAQALPRHHDARDAPHARLGRVAVAGLRFHGRMAPSQSRSRGSARRLPLLVACPHGRIRARRQSPWARVLPLGERDADRSPRRHRDPRGGEAVLTETFFAPCPRGLAGVLAEELAGLGALHPEPAEAGVAFTGPFD